MDLRLGQRTVGRFENWPAELEDVLREVEVEEGGLELLVLRGGGQHVVRLSCGLGHEHVDADAHVEASHRFAHALAVGDRVQRVARLDDHRPVAVRVIGEDLLGDHVAGDEATDEPRPDDRRHRRRAGVELGAAHAQQVAELDIAYWPPGIARFPVSSHTSFSR